jgi:hypothetical protein
LTGLAGEGSGPIMLCYSLFKIPSGAGLTATGMCTITLILSQKTYTEPSIDQVHFTHVANSLASCRFVLAVSPGGIYTRSLFICASTPC